MLYLRTGGRSDIWIIPYQTHLQTGQGPNRVERSLIAKLCTIQLSIQYLTDQTYAGSKLDTYKCWLRHSLYNLRGLDMQDVHPPYS
jgi:hypothetical protein